jgi:hypothetical protein
VGSETSLYRFENLPMLGKFSMRELSPGLALSGKDIGAISSNLKGKISTQSHSLTALV